MNASRRTFLRKTLWAVFAAIAASVAFVAKEIFDYALPPRSEKHCDFTFPPDETQTPHPLFNTPSDASLKLSQTGGFINDASCLNKTPIYGIVEVRSEKDIQNALRFASQKSLKLSIAGQRHSMGGQSFSKGGLVLDMRGFNRVGLNMKTMTLTAQSGATWAQIQPILDREGLSVKAMQSINVPTVGGTLSANAHGIAHNPGQIAPTVRSFRIMLSNGEVKTATPTQNTELFALGLGGYGLFGVILDADLEVTTNDVYEWKTQYMNYGEFPDYYKEKVEGNNDVGLAYGRLSVSPTSYLTETAFHTYEKRPWNGPAPSLKPVGHDWVVRLVLNASKRGAWGRRIRWDLEKHVERSFYPCLSRNQAMTHGEGCLVTRNHEMADSMNYLKNRLEDTNILQEYFIPQEKMTEFVDGLRQVVNNDEANLLNVTIRIVQKDLITALPYAKENMFAFVLYFNQRLDEAESKRLQKTTFDLVDVALGLGGTFYLPYQLYYSAEQLHRAYPEIARFFEAKKKYDPTGLFTNKFYEKYAT